MVRVFDEYCIGDENHTPLVTDFDVLSEEDEISDGEVEAMYYESLIGGLTVEGEFNQVEFYGSEFDSDPEVSYEEELYDDFIIHAEAKYLSDAEDEYVSEESDSELFSMSEGEMERSDVECGVLAGGSGDVKQASGHGRRSGPSRGGHQALDRAGIG